MFTFSIYNLCIIMLFFPLAVVDCGNVPNVTNAIATLVDGDTI